MKNSRPGRRAELAASTHVVGQHVELASWALAACEELAT
jgi:hypothetical protein